MKRKSISRKGMYAKLDKIVSEIVINRDRKCVVCGRKTTLGTGHIFSRRHLATRWDVVPDGNCHCQCWSCNFHHVRDQHDYFIWYINLYGLDKFEELRRRYRQETHF